METTDILTALDRAIDAEKEARRFYLRAADRTDDPGGAAMFRQLADFEAHHRDRLEALKEALRGSGGWIEYEGWRFSKTPGAESVGRKAAGDHADALDALRAGIAAEERAEAEYRALADAAPDERGRQMFRKLAEEEALHRKLLDDQYFALSNRGEWLWGD